MGRYPVCDCALRLESYFLSGKKEMLYEVYLQNGPLSPWLALKTTDKQKAHEFLLSTKAQYVYLLILEDDGTIVSMRCEPNQINGL